MRRGPGRAAGSRRRVDGGPLVPVRRRGGELMGGDTPERWGGDNPQLSTRYRNVPPWNVPGELGRAECGERPRRSLRSLVGGLRSWLPPPRAPAGAAARTATAL